MRVLLVFTVVALCAIGLTQGQDTSGADETDANAETVDTVVTTTTPAAAAVAVVATESAAVVATEAAAAAVVATETAAVVATEAAAAVVVTATTEQSVEGTTDEGAETYSGMTFGGPGSPGLLKLHGVFMSVAWLTFASIAIIMARYYKDMWPDSVCCGEKVWFGTHRFLMVCVLLLTIAGIISIFVYQGGYNNLENVDTVLERAHPAIGLMITALAFVNPMMALCRPKPDHPKRIIFNWAHWAVGTTAHVSGILNVLLGLNLPMAATYIAPYWLIWVAAGFIAFHVFTEVLLQAQRCQAEIYNSEEATGLTASEGEQGGAAKPRGVAFRKTVVGVYIIVALAVGMTFLVGIVDPYDIINGA